MLQVELGALLGKSEEYRLAHEEVLNQQRDFLISLVEDDNTNTKIKDLALKLIILIGNIRASGEDYLIALNLINKYSLTTNLFNELEHNINFKVSKEEENDQEKFKVIVDGKI